MGTATCALERDHSRVPSPPPRVPLGPPSAPAQGWVTLLALAIRSAAAALPVPAVPRRVPFVRPPSRAVMVPVRLPRSLHCRLPTFYSLILSVVAARIASSFCLLRMKSVCGRVFSRVLDKYLRVDLLGRVSVFGCPVFQSDGHFLYSLLT